MKSFFQTLQRSELSELVQGLILRSNFFATLVIQKQDALKEVAALNEKNKEFFLKGTEECQKLLREGVDQSYRDYKKEIEKIKSNMKSIYDNQMWRHRNEMSWVKLERDILKDRENRRSKQRREKRLRKKERLAATKGLNRMDVDANQADEE